MTIYFELEGRSKLIASVRELTETAGSLPTPLRQQVLRLLDAMRQQDPVAAAWFLQSYLDSLP